MRGQILAYADAQGHVILNAVLAYADSAGRVYAVWDEGKHPRQPSGSEKGGEFAPGGGSGGVPELLEPVFGNKDPYVYHLTGWKELEQIQKEGLRGSSTGYSGAGVYFGNSTKVAESYYRSTGAMLRAKKESLIKEYGHFRDGGRLEFDDETGEVLLPGKGSVVSANYLEVKRSNGWISLSAWRLTKRLEQHTYAILNSLYVSRPVLNADEIIAWAKSVGFKTTLPAEDMHVTVCYSKEPVNWSALDRLADILEVPPEGVRTLAWDESKHPRKPKGSDEGGEFLAINVGAAVVVVASGRSNGRKGFVTRIDEDGYRMVWTSKNRITQQFIGKFKPSALKLRDVPPYEAREQTPSPESEEPSKFSAYSDRTISKLGDEGAAVLKFESGFLQSRHQYFKDHGASWDYDGYHPHITISYDPPEDLSRILPYAGPIVLGPEVFAEVEEGWAEEIKELAQDDEGHEGVWRTIRGRKVFIRDGEDLATALDRSLRTAGGAKKKLGSEHRKALNVWSTIYDLENKAAYDRMALGRDAKFNEILDASPKFSGTVYRGTAVGGRLGEAFKKVGSVVRFGRHVPTTPKREIAADRFMTAIARRESSKGKTVVLLSIKGRSGVQIGRSSVADKDLRKWNEVVYPKSTKFRVASVVSSSKTWAGRPLQYSKVVLQEV